MKQKETIVKGQFDAYEDHVFLSRGRKLSFGMVGFGQAIIEDVVNNYMFLFYNTILMVPGRWIGWAFCLTRVFDAVTDPIMGHISDNTRSRWGRRRPYILIGSIFLSLCFAAMCIPPTGFSSNNLFWYLAIIALLYFTAYTITIVPVGALGAELSIDYHERTRLNAYRSFLNRVGAVLAGSCWYIAGLFPTYRYGFAVIGLVFAVLSFGAYLWAFLGTRENAELQLQEKTPFFRGFLTTVSNRPFWMLTGIVLMLLLGVTLGFPAGSYINIYYVFGGDQKAAGTLMLFGTLVFNATAMISLFPITWVGVRFGKERAMLLGTTIFALAPLSSWFLFDPNHPYLQLLFQVPVAVALTSVMVYAQAMIADLVDLDEFRTHKRREGSYSAVMAFIWKLATPLGVLGWGYLLDNYALFQPKETMQSPETVHRLRLMLVWAPFIPCAIAAILSLLYPIREKHVRDVRRLLETRRAERGVA